MNPGLLLSSVAVIVVMVLAMFSTGPGEWMGIVPATHPVLVERGIDMGTVLYVCPVANTFWDEISGALTQFRTQIFMIWIGLILFLLTSVAWAFYQNLIKDKFDENSWKFSTGFARTLFWASIIGMIMLYGPNSYKTVGVTGTDARFILCEYTTPGARPLPYSSVNPRVSVVSDSVNSTPH